ncbi:MAG: protein-disulfide reductase DsbD family protein [Brevundimonas sp.]|jgi:thiol:disulfide interchange protein/DsbC/DsbD-like thiol-disulfide interchange protein|uniref:protein-disulfide reductase DsbD family protein n=1 Tax=Brevundimonas sp. TaxID=1871086 RepID=UPI00391A2B60
MNPDRFPLWSQGTPAPLLIMVLALMLALMPSLWGAVASAQQGGAVEGPEVSSERISARLVPMTRAATPGSTLVLAVRQDIEPGWHTYWRNPGDSGGATRIEWRLPEGWEAGDIIWPLPERQRIQTLMNYGYSDVVYLPVPLEVPAGASGTVSLEATVHFMVCSDEMCVPDSFEMSLELPLAPGEAAMNAPHADAIARVMAEAPRSSELSATVSRSGETVLLSVSGPELASREAIQGAYFFPYLGGVIDHAAVQQGEAGENGLTLTLTPGGLIRASGLTEPVQGVLATAAGAWEITAVPGEPLAGTAGGGALRSADEGGAGSAAAMSLAGFLQAVGLAFLGGLILNLMPCVFPVLSMKAASLASSASVPREARIDGLMFLLGVVVSFLVLAGALLGLRAAGEAIGWGFQLQSPGVIAALGLLMLAVALNLSGVFEIGAGLQAAGGRASYLNGRAGAFLTGVLAVLVAAPCTAPFMGVAMGTAMLMPWIMALMVFAALGVGLALPYVLIAFSPRLLSLFPRPGPWMEQLRGLLAFPMYGAAAWLAWVLSRQSGSEALALFFLSALVLALSAWLFGQAQRKQDRALGWRIAAGVMLALALGLSVVTSRMAPSPSQTAAGSVDEVVLGAQPWSPQAVQAALDEGRPVLVNFTADWCVTCKINERTALANERTRAALASTNTLYLVGDWTLQDAQIAAELAAHGRSGVPLYLLYRPGADQPEILPQILTTGIVVRALSRAGDAS